MVKTMKTGSTARQIDLGKGNGKPAMMATQLEQASAERRSLYHTQRWLRVRRQFLMDHPLCIECEREGLVVAAAWLITGSVISEPIGERGSGIPAHSKGFASTATQRSQPPSLQSGSALVVLIVGRA